jgi:hypothetical protein
MFNGRRQPSCDGTSRMTRECQVRICERLGVKFPGPTRREYWSSSAMAYPSLGAEWSVPFRLIKLEQGNGTGRIEVAEHRCRRFACCGEESLSMRWLKQRPRSRLIWKSC